jgi:hypothetical protein
VLGSFSDPITGVKTVGEHGVAWKLGEREGVVVVWGANLSLWQMVVVWLGWEMDFC